MARLRLLPQNYAQLVIHEILDTTDKKVDIFDLVKVGKNFGKRVKLAPLVLIGTTFLNGKVVSEGTVEAIVDTKIVASTTTEADGSFLSPNSREIRWGGNFPLR